MRNIRIYQPADYHTGSSLQLSKAAYQHAIKVLRLTAGDELIVFNGKGQSATAVISELSSASCTVTIQDLVNEHTESDLHIHLGLSVSKGERMDYAIQKSVEAGVSEITPLMSERTVVRLDARREQKRLEHWHGVILSACEQSGRSLIPRLNSILPLTDWLRIECPCKLVFDARGEITLEQLTPVDSVAVLIGPEGGLSEQEIAQSIASGFIQARLGPRILRTETAAVMVCGVLQMLWGDYRTRPEH